MSYPSTDFPDHPIIRRLRSEGMPESPTVYCPVCGGECEHIYKDRYGQVFACENCVSKLDALEWSENGTY